MKKTISIMLILTIIFSTICAVSAETETAIGYTTSYDYDSLNNVISSVQPSERTESFTYTPNNKLETITTDNKNITYDYYASGYIKSITYPNGMVTSYTYDNLNRVTAMQTIKDGIIINNLSYEYDANSNVISETKNNATTTYSYDSLDRLINVAYNNGKTVSYEYDTLGNRTKEITVNGTDTQIKEYIYNDRYQLTEIKTDGEVTDTYTYNQRGAIKTHNNKTYSYNVWDKLSSVTENGTTHNFVYDTNGIRTQKDNTRYIVDANNNVIAEADADGNITAETVWGHQPLARKTNGSWYYYIYNAHGDVIGLVSDSGEVVNSYQYDAWGNIVSETETIDNPIKYAGEYYDDELSMYYLRARYYDPQIGRFTSYDIEEGDISNPQDMNRYVYCRNNPIKYVDPTGREGVAVTMLWDAFFGSGKDKDYSYNQEIVRTFYSSPNLNKIINANFEKFKKSGLSTGTYSESVSFYGNDLNPNDLDLHLAVGLADYSMTFTKEIIKKRFLWMTWEETVYNVKVTISDRYNFDNYREGQHFSDFLNNLGYDWQKSGFLKPYYWSVTFMKKGL